jgi:hypothetical protein
MINSFDKFSRLLTSLCSVPLRGETLNKTEKRLIEGIERAHGEYLADRREAFRNHQFLLNERAKLQQKSTK